MLLLLVGVFVILLSLNALDDAQALRDHGVRAEARIVAVHDGAKPSTSFVTLVFQGPKGEVRADVGNFKFSPEPKVGQRPTVVYDPRDPAGNVADIRMGPEMALPLVGIIAGVVAVCVAVLAFFGFIRLPSKGRRYRNTPRRRPSSPRG
ncbi:uncharacterized protein DUF3592 [Jatrophihabitans sp. GAS493]|nr:uncharacterized protein DUF3592 [Jatrophihabitans sp. GAS493]